MHSDKALSISIKPLCQTTKSPDTLPDWAHKKILYLALWQICEVWWTLTRGLPDLPYGRKLYMYQNSTRESSSRSYKELNIPSPNIGLSRLLLVLLTHTTYNAMASFITQTSAKNEPHKHQNSILSDSRDLIRCCGMTLKHLKRRCTPHYIVIAVSDQIRKRSVNGCTNCCIFWIHLGDFLGGKL